MAKKTRNQHSYRIQHEAVDMSVWLSQSRLDHTGQDKDQTNKMRETYKMIWKTIKVLGTVQAMFFGHKLAPAPSGVR